MTAQRISSNSIQIWLRILAVLVSGAILATLIRPLSLYWLHWIAYLPMIWALRADTPKSNRWLSLLYGTVAVFTIFRWIAQTIILFSNIPTPVAYLILAIFSLAFGLPYFLLWTSLHPIRRKMGSAWIIGFPAALVLIEWASMWVILFPYNQGVSQYEFPPIWQLASVTGLWGISFLVLFVNCAIGEWFYRRREGRPAPVIWMSTAVIFTTVIGFWGHWRYQWVEEQLENAPTYRVAQLQFGETMSDRLSKPFCDNFYDWVHLTQRIEPGSVDLVVWSEGAVPYAMNAPLPSQPTKRKGASCARPRDPGRIAKDIARKGKFDLLVGAGSLEPYPLPPGTPDYRQYNSVYYFTKTGESLRRYDKMVPLPFGEYLPLSNVFPFIRKWIQGPGNFRAGAEARVFNGSKAVIGPPVCYEAILPSVCRQYANPDLLVNITNDGWFGDTAAPHQHAMLSAVRSVELGIPLYRSAYSGISMLVEPHGRIVAETKPFEDASRVVIIRMQRIPTLYARLSEVGLHNWFVWLCAIFLAFSLSAGPWFLRRRPVNQP